MRQVFQSKNNNSEEINLAKILDLFRKRWYYILISFIVAFIGCKLYLRYARPMYAAQTTIRVEEEKNMGQGLGLLESFGFGMVRDNIQSEIQLIQSRTMVSAALQQMGINCQYYLVGTLVTSEIYKDDSPFVVSYDTASVVPYGSTFSFYYQSGNKFKLQYLDGIETIEKMYFFGENIEIKGFKFQIFKRETRRYSLMPSVEFKWSPIEWRSFIGRAQRAMQVEQSGYMVPILKVTMQDNVAKFTADFLNTLMMVYQEQDIQRKTQAANQALSFIQQQIDTIKLGVIGAEDTLQTYKQNKDFFNVEIKVSTDLEKIRNAEENRVNLVLRKIELDRLVKELKGGDTISTVSYSLDGISDPMLASLISSYNSVVLERIGAAQLYTPEHPKVQEYLQKQRDLRSSIESNVASLSKDNALKIKFFEDKIAVSRSSLDSLPAVQRVLQSLLREFEVKEKILLTLLEKQAEAKIAKASIISSVQIMDKALYPMVAVSPDPKKIYLIGCGLGLCSGLLLILVAGMLKNTVSYREEIESLSFTPIIGVVRRANESLNHKYPRMLSVENPKSSLSESFRSIRTNLQFLASNKDSKVIAITSTISGEGKSFITINLAGMLSLLDIKVVIIDMDLRKPKLHYSFGSDNSIGLSTFLVGKTTLDTTLRKTEYANLDIITSGPIPPNPSELTQSQQMFDLIAELREQYDYILIDTPPVGLVTDGTTMLMHADVALYVVRADYSKRVFVKNPDRLSEERNIRNIYIVFNSVSTANRRYGGYGYKIYGQGYYSDDMPEPKWWEVWKFFRRK